MIKEFIATGNTIEDAQALAMEQLNAPAGVDVSFEVLELPQKKTFGLFGGSKAKVRAYYEAPDLAPTSAPAKTETKPVKSEPKAAAKSEPKAAKPEVKAAAKSEPKAAAKPETKAPQAEIKAEDSTIEYKDVPISEIKPIADYLSKILAAFELGEFSLKAKASGSDLIFDIECDEDYGILIGRRGETLDSIQYLIRLFANRAKTDYGRISINVGNYREKRAGNLRALATKNAQQVARYGRKITLDPMNPSERRIIHTTVQDIEGVTSYSVGTDNERRVVIALAEGFTPNNKGGYNNRGGKNGGFNNNRGGKGGNRDFNKDGGFNKRTNYNNSPKSDRTPAKDAQTVSLYGKIETKK